MRLQYALLHRTVGQKAVYARFTCQPGQCDGIGDVFGTRIRFGGRLLFGIVLFGLHGLNHLPDAGVFWHEMRPGGILVG